MHIIKHYCKKLYSHLLTCEYDYVACQQLVLPNDIVLCIQEQIVKLYIPRHERLLWKLLTLLDVSSMQTRKNTLVRLYRLLCGFPFFVSFHRHIHDRLYIQMDKKLQELCKYVSHSKIQIISDRWILIGSMSHAVFSEVVPLF